jgi:hypothetical protein
MINFATANVQMRAGMGEQEISFLIQWNVIQQTFKQIIKFTS